MFIYYYNSKGELMNNQFIENGQDKIHQHFFTPENVKPTFDGSRKLMTMIRKNWWTIFM